MHKKNLPESSVAVSGIETVAVVLFVNIVFWTVATFAWISLTAWLFQ